MSLNRALKLMRVYHDMKQADLAEKLEVTKSYVSEIEAGNKTPSMDVLNQYAKVFDIPLSSILFFAENVEKPTKISKAQGIISGKIISLLDFIAEKAEKEDGDA